MRPRLSRIFFCILALVVCAGPVLADADIKQREHRVLFAMSLRRGLGGGASLSPEGSEIAYVGADGALHIIEISSRVDRLVSNGVDVEQGLDVFDDPSFSPDGKRIVFSASGGTRYYPSDIYSILLDGKGLEQLTASKPVVPSKGVGFTEYYYTPQYSPDGKQILVWERDGLSGADSAVVISSDGSTRRIVSTGQPLYWVNQGKVILVARESGAFEYDLASGMAGPVRELMGEPLGALREANTVALTDGDKVSLFTIKSGIPSLTHNLAIPLTLSDSIKSGKLTLHMISSDQTDSRMLLDYQNEISEVLEVIQVRP